MFRIVDNLNNLVPHSKIIFVNGTSYPLEEFTDVKLNVFDKLNSLILIYIKNDSGPNIDVYANYYFTYNYIGKPIRKILGYLDPPLMNLITSPLLICVDDRWKTFTVCSNNETDLHLSCSFIEDL